MYGFLQSPMSTNNSVSHIQGKKSCGSVPTRKGQMGSEEEWMGQVPPRHTITPGQDSVDNKSCHEGFQGIFINMKAK